MGLHIFEREGDLRQISKKIKACLPVQVRIVLYFVKLAQKSLLTTTFLGKQY